MSRIKCLVNNLKATKIPMQTNQSKMVRRKIAIVGAGPTGLCCAKNALDYGCDVTVYERNSEVGGTWIYTDQTGNDEYGQPIHSSMYKGLRTNVPVELMGFLNHPFPKKQRSFVPHDEVLAFFRSYASEYNLLDVIKFQNQVVNVRPLAENRWEVLSRDLPKNVYETHQFDAIFLCNGHYSSPSMPQYDGLDLFNGHIGHSHDYRRPEQYAGKSVLIIGSGPSGRDIMYEIASQAKSVLISHHAELKNHNLPANVEECGDVKRFNVNSVEFTDGKERQIDCTLFCTGYKFTFPFLSIDCGLCVDDGYFVHPLYKHVININRPTMAVVGLQICAYTIMYDLQARLCLRYWTNEIPLPSKQQMLEDFRIETDRRNLKNNIRKSHLLSDDQTAYLRELSSIGEMIKVPEVILKIFLDCNDLRAQYPNTYREFNYKIIDDDNFEVHHG